VDPGKPDWPSRSQVYPVLSSVTGENQHGLIRGNTEKHKTKKAVSRRIHGWHEHVPARGKALQAQPVTEITGITAAVWPPIRRKKKAEIHAQAKTVENNMAHDLLSKDPSGPGEVSIENRRRRHPDRMGQISKV